MIVCRFRLLLLVHDDEVDVGSFVGRAMGLAKEGFENAVQMRLRTVCRKLEGEAGGRLHFECLIENRERLGW